jgi:ribose transport system permease protein
VLRNGLVLAGINAYWQIVLVGGIIILAVLVDRMRTMRMTP